MKIVVCTSVLIEWIFMGKTHLIKSFMLKLWCFLYTTILKIILSLGLIHFVHLKHKYLSYFNDTLQYKNTCWIVILNLQMIILAPVGNYYIIILPLQFLISTGKLKVCEILDFVCKYCISFVYVPYLINLT